MVTETKTCAECEHFWRHGDRDREFACHRLEKVHPVTGYKISLLNPYRERALHRWWRRKDRCGPEGKYWTQRNPPSNPPKGE